MDFPGGPVVRALRFHCRGHGFDPWSRKLKSCKPRSTAKKTNSNISAVATPAIFNTMIKRGEFFAQSKNDVEEGFFLPVCVSGFHVHSWPFLPRLILYTSVFLHCCSFLFLSKLLRQLFSTALSLRMLCAP